MSLYTKLESIIPGNREDLLSKLSSMSDFDCDFVGENGIDYLWGEVWKANGFADQEEFMSQNKSELKYESNLDWLLDQVRPIESDKDCIEAFFRIWMEHDGSYYSEYETKCLLDENERAIAVCFAATTRY